MIVILDYWQPEKHKENMYNFAASIEPPVSLAP